MQQQLPKAEPTQRLTDVAPLARTSPRSKAVRPLVFLTIFGVLLCIAFIGPLANWVRFALSRDRNTYLLLVPVISAYLIRSRRAELSSAFKTSIPAALLPAAVGIVAIACLGSISNPINRLSLQIFSLLNLLLAGGFVFVGASTLRQIIFPIAFLIFTVPVPTVVAEQIEIFLQYTSAESAYWLMSIAGIPMIRDGINFRLPNIYIQVAQECSGYNSTFALFMVSTVAGYLFLKSPAKRVILSLAVIPLAILRNGFRVTTLAALCVYVDPELINSYIHHHGGPIFFALSLIPFFILLWGLRKSEIAKDRTK